MAYRHLMPIVVVVALVAGAMGAFLGFPLTEDSDEDCGRGGLPVSQCKDGYPG